MAMSWESAAQLASNSLQHPRAYIFQIKRNRCALDVWGITRMSEHK